MKMPETVDSTQKMALSFGPASSWGMGGRPVVAVFGESSTRGSPRLMGKR